VCVSVGYVRLPPPPLWPFTSSCCCLPLAWLPLDYITLSSVQTQLAQFINMLHGHVESKKQEKGVGVGVGVEVGDGDEVSSTLDETTLWVCLLVQMYA